MELEKIENCLDFWGGIGIDEVFGNLSESGFQEIKRLIDVSNNIGYRGREVV